MPPKKTKSLTVGVIRFPGSNCEQDCIDAIERQMDATSKYVWHQDTDLSGLDALMLPGGFSYGDYLRSGAIARFSPIMEAVVKFANEGRPVIGICNGFQVLTESGLLPGALVRNKDMSFICDQVGIEVVNIDTPFTNQFKQGQKITLPVAHADGNYTISEDDLKFIEDNNQVVFRYTENINGSVNNIAGVRNIKGNVVGLMPHPERNLSQSTTGLWNGDGATVFDSLLNHCLNLVGV